ncbi:MAG TPA: hypothetical protein VGH96_03870 [Streptosporangiaceae bacterium]
MRAGEPERLLGPAECEWLDVKDGVYKLDDPAQAEELVKDVGGFANAKTAACCWSRSARGRSAARSCLRSFARCHASRWTWTGTASSSASE